ncbi:MAG: hypothetical protein ACWA5X_05730 [bacterium]
MAIIRPLKLVQDPVNAGKYKIAEAVDGDTLPNGMTGSASELDRHVLKLATGLYLVGEAVLGTATNVAEWRIYQLDLRLTGAPVRIYADGSTLFDKTWVDAESYAYAQ